MKKVLIISPYFPPSNAADMQRIRMSLPYFEEFGWEAEVVTVAAEYSDIVKDPLLCLSIPNSIKVHFIDALPKKWTSKIGLGSLALRSLWFYRKKVNKLLTHKHFDLILFSTTQFPVCVLGRYWKRKFNVPYIIDIQDPWHSDYYQDKPRSERPSKYWFSYRLNKYLEPTAMRKVSGLISVSQAYIDQLRSRYAELLDIPAKVLTFGYFENDLKIAEENELQIELAFPKEADKINIVYIGRGGFDMSSAIKLLFTAFKALLNTDPFLVSSIKMHFIGTSYAPAGQGRPSFLTIAEEIGIKDYVIENTDRVTYYEMIKALQQADGLFVPGSNDPGYTASKLYPYILARKPILGIFQKSSSAFEILTKSRTGIITDLNDEKEAINDITSYLLNFRNMSINPDWEYIEAFSAKNMTKKQCDFFNAVI